MYNVCELYLGMILGFLRFYFFLDFNDFVFNFKMKIKTLCFVGIV